MEVINLFPWLIVLQHLDLSLCSATRLLLKLNSELMLLFRRHHNSYERQAKFTQSGRLKGNKQEIMRYFRLLEAPKWQWHSRLFFLVRAGGKKDPRTRGRGGTFAQGLMLGMGKIFWTRADVWRLLFCKVTTKKGRQKIEGQLLS